MACMQEGSNMLTYDKDGNCTDPAIQAAAARYLMLSPEEKARANAATLKVARRYQSAVRLRKLFGTLALFFWISLLVGAIYSGHWEYIIEGSVIGLLTGFGEMAFDYFKNKMEG